MQISPFVLGGKALPCASMILISTCASARPVDPILAISMPGSIIVSALHVSVMPNASMNLPFLNTREKSRIRVSGVFSPPAITHLKVERSKRCSVSGKDNILLTITGAIQAQVILC